MNAATHCQKFAGDYLSPPAVCCVIYKQAFAVCPVNCYAVAMKLLRQQSRTTVVAAAVGCLLFTAHQSCGMMNMGKRLL